MLNLAQKLNPEQLEAATTTEGPLLVLAGAGSGKTRVLVHRIAHILAEAKAEPWQIFAVTFTNKAAREMRTRLTDLLGPEVKEAWIGTFHALCARILRLEGQRLGFDPGFTIYDADDAKRLLKTIMEELGIDPSSHGTPVNGVAHEIDKAKNAGITPAVFRDQTMKFETPSFRAARRVYPKYQKALAAANAMDFGDLLLWALELLKHHPPAKNRFGRRFRYVLVDEFQDTNRVQYELLQQLVETHNNLAVVGDDDQSIYRWRGADVGNILGFHRRFPAAKVVKLEENYRSTANILAAANSVIRQNQNRHAKTLRTQAAAGEAVAVTLVESGEAEAALVARTILQAQRADDRLSLDDIAILYRQNAQSRAFEEAFRRVRIPFRIVGGTGFYERKEVKDILAYLRVTANPRSRQDFERIVNVPSRKIGPTTVKRIRSGGETEAREGAELLSASDEAMRGAGLGPAAIKKLRALDIMLAEFRALAGHASAAEVAIEIIEKTGYLGHLRQSDPATAEDRIANVQELVSSIAEHEAQVAQAQKDGGLNRTAGDDPPALGMAGARTPLQAFLDEAALTAPDEANDGQGITLMTIHAAKGLEFPLVFMVGMEEMTFPSRRTIDDPDPTAIEEERRLCYVGMTRAMKRLFLSAARYRRIYGQEEVRSPSRFLGELPDAVVGNFPELDSARRWARAADAVASPPGVAADDRGGDRVEYDEPAYHGSTTSPASTQGAERRGRRASSTPPQPENHAQPGMSDAPFSPGSPVHHNLFGRGLVRDIEGSGPKARLTIEFPGHGTKKVIARFVKPALRT